MTSRTYVDVHVVQTVPPSNVNRDDAGSPKQAIYGGARRARVSSQAWKRATRSAFVDHIPAEQLATRTRRISTMLANRLAERAGLDTEHAARITTAMLTPLGIKQGKKESDTAYLLFFGRPQLERLADLVADRAVDLAGMGDDELGKELAGLPVKDVLGAGHPLDVALFGRMVADIPGLNVDAATQVAHALSTHPVEIEFDYFTAVDDENPKEDTGAGMIGSVEFNSATLYRFATVGLHQLLDNLGGDVEATVTALRVFLTCFVSSMPTGHQNSFAHRTLPSLVSVVVRDDQPVNLVSAFETPVQSKAGIAVESAARLIAELSKTSSQWGLRPVQVASTYTPLDGQVGEPSETDVLGAPMPFTDVVAAVTSTARARLTGEEIADGA